MYKRILVPVDGSECSAKGLLEAVRLARSTQAALQLLHVVNEVIVIHDGVGAFTYSAQLLESVREAGKAVLKSSEAIVSAQGVNAESVLLEQFGQRAADAIIEQAKKWPADLIVMGTHGRRGMSRLVMGSDAELIVRMAPCPVLLVRTASD